MLFIKNNAIFGLIGGIFKLIFKFIYGIIKLFNLQLTFFYLVLALVLQLIFGIVGKNDSTMLVFYIGLGITVAYAVIATIAGALGIPSKREKNKRGKINIVGDIGDNNDEKSDHNFDTANNKITTVTPTIISEPENTDKEQPNYFRVKQNPSYVMAEYKDRYVLYYELKEGLLYVRTDYK